LNQETAREILMFIIERKNSTQSDIVGKIGISAASANWHVKRLIAFKIIDEVREGSTNDTNYMILMILNT
jgi:predicted transcriptional regulator